MPDLRLEGKWDQLKGKIRSTWGDLTDDERTKAEGMAEEMKGKGEQAVGDLKDRADELKRDIDRAI